jgi:hypothetical protein
MSVDSKTSQLVGAVDRNHNYITYKVRVANVGQFAAWEPSA